MTNIKWDKLSLEELKSIQKEATKAISSYEARKRKEALAAVEAKAAEMGFSLSELTGGAKPKGPKAPPKYCHPENPAKTWTGRGRQPNWVKEALAGGKALEDLLIAK
ncbi:H-NS histone family protein [uncultured Tateyamaria sp.]|uniref:H-NS histone family protein n=1 Tax=uncultured Tateyamaria sp. TaxID=455651 RepID=UPI0026322245|nr:H-NS histone family protein [uncultured Tateyamaria sp.]